MQFKLKTPCVDCPFRKDRFFPLTKERKVEIANSLVFEDKTFACHKTVDYDKWDEEGEYNPTDGEQHCAGSLIVLAKTERLFWNFMFRLFVMSKLFDPSKLDMNAPVYDSMDEWVDATE